MRTLRLIDRDFSLNENGEFELIDKDEEIAQGVQMCLAIRKGEFELDEHIGMDRSFLGQKRITDEQVTDSVLEALQVMTDQDIIEGADQIQMKQIDGIGQISLRVLKGEGAVVVEGVDIDGA